MVKLATVFFALSMCLGCNRSRSVSMSATPQPNSPQELAPKSHDVTDPSCCGLSIPANKGIDVAWAAFTKDNRYRLALERDMRFSSAARSEMTRTEGRSEWSALNHILAYSWGHLDYETDQDLVAAIVVDTTRNDPSRFGLVIFGKPSGSTYRPYWLYRERDLSKTVVYQVSGSLGVMTYHDEGKYDNCWVEWRPRQKNFVCP